MKKNKQIVIGLLVAVFLTVGVYYLLRSQKQPPTGVHLRVLVITPLTGPGASLGKFVQQGVEIAKAQIASEHSRKVFLEVEYLDSKNQAKEGLLAYESAKSRGKPDAVICAMSSVAKALIPVCEEDGVFMVATTTALTGLPQGTRNVIRIYPTSLDFVEPTIRSILLKHGKTGIFYVNDDYGRSNKDAAKAIMAKTGKPPVFEEPFELAATDHRSLLTRALASGQDSIFVTGYGPAYASLLKQLREAAPSLPINTEMAFANPAILAQLGAGADGIVFAGTEIELSESSNTAASEFKKTFHTQYGTEAYMVAGFARDSLKLIVEAASKNGSSFKPSKSEAIRLAPFAGCIGPIHLDADGESRIPLQLMQRDKSRTTLIK